MEAILHDHGDREQALQEWVDVCDAALDLNQFLQAVRIFPTCRSSVLSQHRLSFLLCHGLHLFDPPLLRISLRPWRLRGEIGEPETSHLCATKKTLVSASGSARGNPKSFPRAK